LGAVLRKRPKIDTYIRLDVPWIGRQPSKHPYHHRLLLDRRAHDAYVCNAPAAKNATDTAPIRANVAPPPRVNSSAKLLGGIYPFANMRFFVVCAAVADGDNVPFFAVDDGCLSAVVTADILSKYRNKG